MILPRFISKLLAVFRGSVAPPLIFLSVMIGFWTGLMPGWSGLHTALLVVVLVLNVHIGLFLLSLGIGKAVSLAAAPVLYHIGVWGQESLSGLLAALAAVPVIGITDFGKYALVGALIAGPIVGAVLGLILAFAVISFRRMMVKFDEKSDKFRTFYSKTWGRILDRLLIGKRAKDVKSMFVKARYIRKAGLVLAVLVVGGFLAVAHFLQNTTVKDYATETLTRTNGAEVNLANLGISLLGGGVSAEGLQVTDAQNPQQNQVVVEKVEAKASIYDLLLGRLVMENVEISGVQFDQLRQAPGKVIEAQTKEEKPFDPNAYDVVEGISKLEKYVKDAQKVKEQLQKLSKWLPQGKQGASETEQVPHKYLDYLTLRAETLPSPKLLAKRILADKVGIPSELFGSSEILMTNLSDAPQAVSEPMTLELKSHETPAAMKVAVDHAPDGTPQISGTFDGFDLSKVQSSLGDQVGLAFQSGSASGSFKGQVTSEQVDLTIGISLKDLKATGQGNGVLGLGAQQTSEIMSVLTELGTTIRVVGPITEPRLVFDTKGLGEEFKQALVKAGKDRLQKEIDNKLQEQLGDKLGDKVPEQLKDAIKTPSKGLVEGLGGLLGGKKTEEDKPQP
jgi:uncharacterized protein (TIGR03546 family)